MSNLKRYGERENKFGLWQLLQCDDGEFVKFDDIKEFLPTSAQHSNGAEPSEICPECNGSGLPKFVNQTNCTLCKGRGKLRHC